MNESDCGMRLPKRLVAANRCDRLAANYLAFIRLASIRPWLRMSPRPSRRAAPRSASIVVGLFLEDRRRLRLAVARLLTDEVVPALTLEVVHEIALLPGLLLEVCVALAEVLALGRLLEIVPRLVRPRPTCWAIRPRIAE